MLKTLLVKATFVAFVASVSFAAHAIADTQRFDVPAGDLIAALESFAKQADIDLVYQDEQVKGLRTKGVSGDLSAQEAVTKLLEGTPLQLRLDDASGAMLITRPTPSGPATSSLTNPSPGTGEGGTAQRGVRIAQADDERKSDSSKEDSEGKSGYESQDLPGPEDRSRAIPEILVIGSKSLNMDIRRSPDDAQPYIVFDRSTIETSAAASLDDFLKQRLTANTNNISSAQGSGAAGTTSRINLRGLGTDQTLILVDGHRLPSSRTFGGTPQQPDINAIPLAAIERIEVLPTTSSGIYGGSATAGVVNIVLRRNYDGLELKASHENSFKPDPMINRLDVGAGLSFENGRTWVLLAASLSKQNQLLVGDRDFIQTGRAEVLSRNPSFFLSAASPPLGATPNIRSATGSNLVLDDGTALNSPITFVPVGYSGTTSDAGAGLVANAGSYNLDLPESAQRQGGRLAGLLNGPRRESAMITLRREFLPNVQAFLDLGGSNTESRINGSTLTGVYTIPASAPTNPFRQDIIVTIPNASGDEASVATTRDRRVVGGAIVGLRNGWKVEVDHTRDEFQFEFAFPKPSLGGDRTGVQNGTIDVIRDTTRFPVDLAPFLGPNRLLSPQKTTLNDSALRFNGPLFATRGGNVALSGMVAHRIEEIGEVMQVTGANTFFYPSRSQSNDSAYVETKVPVVSEKNRHLLIAELELQLATRWDRYRTHGATGFLINPTPQSVIDRVSNEVTSTNPTIALRYKPSQDLVLRGSYGTGFLPPSVGQLTPTPPQPVSGGAIDPRRGNEVLGAWQLAGGGNPSLQPEKSDSTSAGVIITPRALSGLRLSVDYTKIEKRDTIHAPTIQQLIDNESLLPDAVVRGPVPAGDQFGVGPIIMLRPRLANIAKVSVEAFDLAFDYSVNGRDGSVISFWTQATWQTHLKIQLVPTTPITENVGITSANPLKFRANVGATWQRRNWTLGWTGRYFDSYFVADPSSASSAVTFANQGGQKVKNQVYHDLFFLVPLPDEWEILGTVANVFNEKPSFDASPPTMAPIQTFVSPYGDPRLATYRIDIKKRF